MSEPPIALIIAFCVLSFIAIPAGLLYFKRDLFGPLFGMIRSKVVAEIDADPLEPYAFNLRHLSQKSRPHRVCVKLRLSGGGSYSSTGGHSASVGLSCSYQVTIGGQVVTQEVIGYGSTPPRPFDRHIAATFFSSVSNTGGGGTKTGTIILTKLDRCAPGTEIGVQGTFKLDPGTQAGPLVVSLRA
jgi:hypothetical protein